MLLVVIFNFMEHSLVWEADGKLAAPQGGFDWHFSQGKIRSKWPIRKEVGGFPASRAPPRRLAVRKEILRRRGAIRSAAVRAPGPRLDAHDLAELDRLLSRLEARLREGANGRRLAVA
jgi:hypothetical protein